MKRTNRIPRFTPTPSSRDFNIAGEWHQSPTRELPSRHTRKGLVMGFTLLVLSLTLTAIPALFGVAVFAQSPAPPNDYNLTNTACAAGLPCGKVSPVAVVSTIINIVVSVLGVIAVVMVVYGGILWMTAAGNEEKITKAKSLLMNAVIGLAIIMMAFAISSFVFNTLKKATIAPVSNTGVQCAQTSGPVGLGSCKSACAAGETNLNQVDCPFGQTCCAL